MRHTERQRPRIPVLAIAALTLALGWLPGALWAQVIIPVKSVSVNGQPNPPGYIPVPGQTTTLYYYQFSMAYDGGTGTTVDWYGNPYTIDATGFFKRTNNAAPFSGMPSGWVQLNGSALEQCLNGNMGGVIITLMTSPLTTYQTNWGTFCGTYSDPGVWEIYDQAIHPVNQQNGPVFLADPPARPAPRPDGDSSTTTGSN